MKVPSSNGQAPTKLQMPISNHCSTAFWRLEPGSYLEIGTWSLELLCFAGCQLKTKIMRTSLLTSGQVDHRAELECVRHRMMLRARHRARCGRWWLAQGRRNQPDRLKAELQTAP